MGSILGQNSNANVLHMLGGLTKDIRELQRGRRSRPSPRAEARGDGDSNARVIENLGDYLSSARSLVITAPRLSVSQTDSDNEERLEDQRSEFEPMDGSRMMTSISSRSYPETDTQNKPDEAGKVPHEPTSERAAHGDSSDSTTTEPYHSYVLPRRNASQHSQIRLSPEVLMFIDECEKVERLRREGRILKASHLGIAFLKTLVRRDVPPEKWDDIEKNILHADERGLASSVHGFTVLHLLALNDLSQYIKVLLAKGANYNAVDRDHYTPLHTSCWCGHHVTPKLLIEAGARIEAKTKDHCTPLHFACQGGHYETARLLVENGADLEVKDRDQRTPLSCACRNGHLETASLLIERGAHLEAKSTAYLSPLHYACGNGHPTTARLLIDKGASVEARSKDNCTPLHIACLNGHYATAKGSFGCKLPPLQYLFDLCVF